MIVYIARDGAEFGEYPREELEPLAREGELRPTDLCWFEGMADWLLLEDFLGQGIWKQKRPVAVAPVKPTMPSLKELRPARVKPMRPRTSPSRPRPRLPVSEPRVLPVKPESRWIFITAMICVALIWAIAIAIKSLGLITPEPAPVSLLPTPSPPRTNAEN